ncbi:MAG: long-chain N-acyl amino acid synthase [Pseudomonadota bacterium]
MKEKLLRWFGARRGKGAQARNDASAHGGESVPPAAERSGVTVFAAPELPARRFRNLTLPEAGQSEFPDESDTQPAFKIRLAKSAGFRREASTLVSRRYSDRGYIVPGIPSDPDLYSFLAYDDGAVVGTVSIRLDSPRGLSADELYREELDALRRRGWRICEFTRLAVDVRTASKPVLAGLFHTAYLYASVVRGYDHAVIEVNPRHVGFYERALGFEQIGPERINRRVNAPAVLLCVAFETIAEGIARYGGKAELAGSVRSLYPFGFSPEEERGILRRLRELDAARNRDG